MRTVKNIFGNTILLMIGICMTFPFIYMFLTSLKVTYSPFIFDFHLTGITLQNYIDVFRKENFLRFFMNSLIISTAGVVLSVLFCSLAGYGFAKKDFPGNEKIFFLVVMTLIIPFEVTMIPLYIIMKNLDWINTFKALILPIPSAFGVFLMRQAIINIPDALIDSAKIDGCSDLKIFFRIVIPLIKPAIITLTIFTFMHTWNSFMWPLIMATDTTVKTLPVGLATLESHYKINYGLIMAGASVTFLPSFILYILLQKRFIEGVTISGLKG